MTKRKSIYQEGFLCLFDKQGEMFFKSKTVLEVDEDDVWYGEPNVDYLDLGNEQAIVFAGLASDDEEPQCSPPHCPVMNIDLPEVFTYDEYECRHLFIGHFDLIYVSKTKTKYSFGAGQMEGLRGDQENWEYTFCDMDPDTDITLGLLRVVID